MYEDFTETYGPVDSSVIGALEQVWGIKLPSDYRHFLVTINGGESTKCVFSCRKGKDESIVRRFFGITDSPNANLWKNYILMENNGIPKNTLPIAYDSLGNHLVIGVEDHNYGCVYFVDHNTSGKRGEMLARSFTEFMMSLKEDDDDKLAA